jgi:myo-inositol 2-dehydrogenase/D-chiro-inositol 1-dehydrogenase
VRARLAVVGLGRIGRLHAANLAGRVAGGELAGVVDAVAGVARRVGEEHGVEWSTSLADLLPRVAGVVIAAPTAVHADLVERAAAAGVPVFCEKPLGFTVEEAQRAAAGVAQVGFQRRFDPDWLELAGALAGGELGELALFRCSHRNPAEPRGDLGDLFADLAVHDLDAARWLGGEVASVFAEQRPGAACISLRFESGALGLIDVSRRAGYGFECSAELVGSRATARTRTPARVELLRDGLAHTPLPVDHAARHGAAYVAELRHFAGVAGAAARCGAGVGGAAPPAASGDDAVAALRLALLARRSAATGAPLAATAAVFA